MAYIIIGIIFIVAGLIFLKMIGSTEGIVVMIVCGVLALTLLVYGFLSINNNDSNAKNTKTISTSANYNYYEYRLKLN